jgi:delta 1-pyrroline-5-carboxylate dehydrogenase
MGHEAIFPKFGYTKTCACQILNAEHKKQHRSSSGLAAGRSAGAGSTPSFERAPRCDIVPLLMDEKFKQWLVCEQSICINTTAAGGNTALLAS